MCVEIGKNVIIEIGFNIMIKSSKVTLLKPSELKRTLWQTGPLPCSAVKGFSQLWKQWLPALIVLRGRFLITLPIFSSRSIFRAVSRHQKAHHSVSQESPWRVRPARVLHAIWPPTEVLLGEVLPPDQGHLSRNGIGILWGDGPWGSVGRSGFPCSSTVFRTPWASQMCQGFLHWLCRLFPGEPRAR